MEDKVGIENLSFYLESFEFKRAFGSGTNSSSSPGTKGNAS